MTPITDWQKAAYIAGQAADARVNVELETEGMTLNIGPQHPATHGTLRIVVRLDGEQVVWAEPVLRLHAPRLREALPRSAPTRRSPRWSTASTGWAASPTRCRSSSPPSSSWSVEAPPRAQWIRTILFEMARIANITLFLGDMGVQLGAITPVFYAFRDREHVLNLIEAATGGRFHPNFDRIGGLKDDLPKGWIDECKRRHGAASATSATRWKTCSWATRSSQTRTRGIGVIPADVALDYGLSGANLRASGRRLGPPPRRADARWRGRRSTGRSGPTPTATRFARYWVRLQEIREATKIVDQLLDGLPSGPIMAKVPRIIKVPAGEAWVHTENPLGEMGYYVVSKGGLGPFRVQDPHAELQQHLDRAVAAAGRVRPRRHHDPRSASTSSSGTSTGDVLPSGGRLSATGSRRSSRWSSSSASSRSAR